MMQKYIEPANWFVDHFPIISGLVLFLWWGMVRIKRSLFSGYVTNDRFRNALDENTKLIISRIAEAKSDQCDRFDKIERRQMENARMQSQESISIRDLLIKHMDHHE